MSNIAPPKVRNGTNRLEARVDPALKRLFKRAADLQGLTLSDFVINSIRVAALKVVQEHDLIRLTEAESRAFAAALLKPPAPNAALRRAARRYRSIIGAA